MNRKLGRYVRRGLGGTLVCLLVQLGVSGRDVRLPVEVAVASSKLKETVSATFRWTTPPAQGCEVGQTTTVVAQCTRTALGREGEAVSAEVTVTRTPDRPTTGQAPVKHRFGVDWSRSRQEGRPGHR